VRIASSKNLCLKIVISCPSPGSSTSCEFFDRNTLVGSSLKDQGGNANLVEGYIPKSDFLDHVVFSADSAQAIGHFRLQRGSCDGDEVRVRCRDVIILRARGLSIICPLHQREEK
jgi:hypothetical protein